VAAHDLSAGGDVLERVQRVARRALRHYPVSPDAGVTLLQVSENATFRVDDADSGAAILRVHRLGYHSPGEIESELAWMDALRRDAGIRTPRILPASDTDRVVAVGDPATGDRRYCVMFELLPGQAPEEGDLGRFVQLGALTARMHGHARSWVRPAGFTRFRWDAAAAFGPRARWGRWQDAPGVGRDERAVLARLEVTLRRRLEAYGSGPERFGLVHADTRMANLLVSDDEVGVIDFDDCGFSWYLYDLATAFSFFEHRSDLADLVDAWLSGYRQIAPLPATDEAEVPTFVLFRRLLLVAWLGSHSAADISGDLGPGYTVQSCELAESYLRRYG
jgi:Ser/Thr protein kinase RdoA (MazF antagonist)